MKYDTFPEKSEPSGAADYEQLGALVDSLSPEELVAHRQLSIVYDAAARIALSSYRGGMATLPVAEQFPEDYVDLVHRLFDRYDDGRGFIGFPIIRAGNVEELIISASGAKQYRLARRRNPGPEQDITYFTSFPDLTKGDSQCR